jgi:hypothetical protein
MLNKGNWSMNHVIEIIWIDNLKAFLQSGKSSVGNADIKILKFTLLCKPKIL